MATTKKDGTPTKRVAKRKKPINQNFLLDITPLTENQVSMYDEWEKGKNLFTYGCAGTGKTFIALYLALRDILSADNPYQKLYIVRSLVSTREIGFLPGDHDDKALLYQIPYKNMVKNMFKMPDDNEFDMPVSYTHLTLPTICSV